MTVTDTRPEAGAAAPAVGLPLLDEPPGLAGMLTTGDHKRIGRYYIAASLLFLLVGGVLGGVLNVERIGDGELLASDTFSQVYTLHGMVAVFLFLVPLFLGLATYVVPLQVGAANLAFPRGAAVAFWTYLVAGGMLIAAYIANGGPGGGSDIGVDLWIVSLIALNVATVVALISILTTIMTMRAPAMPIDRAPLFTWSVLAGGGLTMLAVPVLVANLTVLYVGHHYGDALTGDFGPFAWFFALPQVYLLAVPAAGIVGEIVPVLGRAQPQRHVVSLVLLAALAVLGYGAFAQDAETFDDLLYVAMGIAVALPALALFGVWAETLRRGSPRLDSPLLLALGSGILLVLAALAGAAAVIEPLDLAGTTWLSGQVHLTLFGAATLGGAAGLYYWAPKIWGTPLSEGSGKLVAATLFLGALLLSVPDLISGLVEDTPRMAADAGGEGLVETMNVLSAGGAALSILGALVLTAAVLATVRMDRTATDDPWQGHTLEWATASPPPAGNFVGPLPEVRSAAPLLDARATEEVPA